MYDDAFNRRVCEIEKSHDADWLKIEYEHNNRIIEKLIKSTQEQIDEYKVSWIVYENDRSSKYLSWVLNWMCSVNEENIANDTMFYFFVDIRDKLVNIETS